jgi:hypothetical protein
MMTDLEQRVSKIEKWIKNHDEEQEFMDAYQELNWNSPVIDGETIEQRRKRLLKQVLEK